MFPTWYLSLAPESYVSQNFALVFMKDSGRPEARVAFLHSQGTSTTQAAGEDGPEHSTILALMDRQFGSLELVALAWMLEF